MAINPMQQQQSPDMLMAMMTDPRATPQQRMAAMSALNTMRGGANAPAQPPQMTGDSTGVSQMDPGFMAAVRQEMLGQGPEEQPEIPQRQAAPEAPQNPSTEALMSGAADASRVAAMARGGAVKGYAEGGESYLERTIRNARSANRGDYSFLGGRGYPRTDILSERLRGLVPPEMTQEEATEKFYTEGEGRNNPQLIKDMFSKIPDISPENYFGGLGSAINKSVGYLYEKAEPYARKAIDYSTGSELTQDPDFVAEELRKKRMGDSAPGEERYQLESLKDFKPTFQEFPINENAAEIAAPDAAIAAPRAKAAERASQALTAPPPAAVEPGKPDAAAEAMNARKQSESDAYKERMDKLLSDDQPLSSQDKYMALLQASLGTMAAASQPGAKFLGSIGQGGMLGVKQLQEAKAARAERNMKQATLLQSQRSEDLNNDARNRQLDISQGGLKVEQANADLKKREYESAQIPGSLEYQKAQAVINYYKSEAVKNSKPDRATEAEYKYNLLVDKGGLAPQEAARVASGVEKNDDLNKAIALKQADEAVKAVDADLKNMSLKPEALKKLKDQAYNDAYNRAYSILNTNLSTQERGAAPPLAGGGSNARPPLNSFGQ